jgi:hypothetical protein
MAVIVIPERDVYLTQSEYNRFHDEYMRAFSFFVGTPPTFNEWVARRKGIPKAEHIGLSDTSTGNSNG